MENINSKMKRHTKREADFHYAPSILAEADIRGLSNPFDFHSHQQYELFILQEGEAYYLINNQVYTISPGTVIIIDGTELHKVQLISESTSYVRSIVHFDHQWIRPVLKAAGADFLLRYFEEFHHRLFTLSDGDQWHQMLNDLRALSIHSRAERTVEKEAEIKLRLVHLLLQIHSADKTYILQETYDRSEKTRIAEEIASYIQRHFDSKWTIRDLAGDLNLSQSYASHIFKEVTGYTIMDYLMNYRLIQAKTYLTMSSDDRSVKEIAYQCGFESDAHFNRFFKKHTGVTPRMFKKTNTRERNGQ